MDLTAKQVLKTIIYFDLFDFPLTLLELWKWHKVPKGQADSNLNSLAELERILSQLGDQVEIKNGLIFLKGRSELIQKRLSAYNLTEEKFKRARKYVKLISLIPFVKAVLVVNRLAYGNVHSQSDIDLAVIVQKNRLWLTRFLTVGLLNFLKVRPKQIKRSKAIDLNFFISEEALNLEKLIFDEDFVFPYWLSQLVFVYDNRKTSEKFFVANRWLKEYLPNFYPYQLTKQRMISDSWLSELIRFKLKLFLDWNFWEKLSHNYQQKILPQELKDLANQDSRVIINQEMLKFHQSQAWKELKNKLEMLYEPFN